jgi:hypothetical protein
LLLRVGFAARALGPGGGLFAVQDRVVSRRALLADQADKTLTKM